MKLIAMKYVLFMLTSILAFGSLSHSVVYAANDQTSAIMQLAETDVTQDTSTAKSADGKKYKKKKAKQKKPRKPVNINTARAETIAKNLMGIGQKKAQAIVEYRKENGEFTAIDDLLKVKGIGKAILKKNKNYIIVSE